MHRKSRTVMLIIVMAFVCVVLPFSLFSGGKEAEAASDGPYEKVSHIDSSSGLDLYDVSVDGAVRRELRSPQIFETGRAKSGTGRGYQLSWIFALVPAAVSLCICMGSGTAPLRPRHGFPARFLCDLFILYQKDGKKRETVLLTM